MIPADRRQFLAATGSAFAALLASGCTRIIANPTGSLTASPYGPLQTDPAGLLDLPGGFSYRVLSRLGDAMNDGGRVPDRADGMGCFDLGNGEIALVRNHELRASHDAGGDLPRGFDTSEDGAILPGGTTTIVLNAATLEVRREFRSLAGMIRNCAGGTTPWGSWLTCEEDVTRAGDGVRRDHGWVFEVPANASGLIDPAPIKPMGRFNHEAACVDPVSGIVYLTEDREDSLLYRYVPVSPSNLAAGGRLQALAANRLSDSRNWRGDQIRPGGGTEARWIDLDNVESPADDLRLRGAARGGTLFARGEGIHMGDGELYFCCTSGGAARLGQIFRLTLPQSGPERLELFFESNDASQFHYGDNLTVSPNGHLIVCEDQSGDVATNHLRGITPAGEAYPLGWLRQETELAGACWSPDGGVLFVNAYSPTATLAISGPWVA
ncbi:alkaline phosphatase PhoX [Erythrobacter sp. MTPC3]|uniref:alkaline phosphatase PhoX n=1 Tax=Erythrobacter sp. MTPC3 TaxID=3056564 RepID=UPI0036F447DE